MSRKKTIDELKKEFDIKHANKYDYSLITSYQNNKTPLPIICHNKDEYGNEHGIFYQTANNHLRGQDCPKCKQRHKRYTTEEYILKCKLIHGDCYDYSKTQYDLSHSHVIITCPKHGDFSILAYHHINGVGCPQCAPNKKLTQEEFIEKSKKVHGDKFDYSLSEYVNCNTPVCIVCPIHGKFWQTPLHHMNKIGCPYCNESHLEREMAIFLKENDIDYEREKTFKWLKSKRKGTFTLDFYLPKYNVAIECQGIQHFKEYKNITQDKVQIIQDRDKEKNDLCAKNGIKVFYYSNIVWKNYMFFLHNDKKNMLENIINSSKNL